MTGLLDPPEDRRPLNDHFIPGQHQALKQASYQHSLARIRSRLKSPERAVSRVIHQPVVEAVSNAATKTIARPLSLLCGAVLALVGTSLMFYLAQRYGFIYNNSLFFLLFAGGFIAGLMIELIVRLVRSSSDTQ